MGLIRLLVTWWDRIPVRGAAVAIVAVIGAILALTGPSGRSCADTSGLRHVYDPSRLHVVAECQTIVFQVVAWRLEHDGDVHVNGIVQGSGASTWINRANIVRQHGLTVVEFVPGDPQPAEFREGETLRLVVTKVLDVGHAGWVEGHPVFGAEILSTINVTSGNPARLAPTTDP